jgi:hypothetical protein
MGVFIFMKETFSIVHPIIPFQDFILNVGIYFAHHCFFAT